MNAKDNELRFNFAFDFSNIVHWGKHMLVSRKNRPHRVGDIKMGKGSISILTGNHKYTYVHFKCFRPGFSETNSKGV